MGSTFEPYLDALKLANVKGNWLSCLTESDLVKLGVNKIGHLRLILNAVESLIEDYHKLKTENMQDILFSVVRAICIVIYNLKQLKFRQDEEKFEDYLEQQHLLVKSLLQLGVVTKKIVSWLERVPFSHMTSMVCLRGSILQCTIKLNTTLQLALNESNLLACVDSMLQLSRGLQDQLEDVIHNCEDSILLTPCTMEHISLVKEERQRYGFSFYTNANNVHIIESVNFKLLCAAFDCGKLAVDDEIVEVNDQLVLGWKHGSVARLIQQSTHRLNMRIRKRPTHCTDYFLGNPRRQRIQLTNSMRPLTAEPQHYKQSDFLRNRTPKRIINPPNNQLETGNNLHENEIAENFNNQFSRDATAAGAEGCLERSTATASSISRPHYMSDCPIVQPSLILSTTTCENLDTMSPCENSLSPLKSEWRATSEEASGQRKNKKQRPITRGSLDDFPTTLASSNRSNWSLNKMNSKMTGEALQKCHRQGWLWLKKTSSFANKYLKRWCVFKDNTLYYYRNPDDGFAEGLILLHGFTISPTSEAVRSGRYPFRVYNDWTRFVFAADSEGSRTRWMNMLGLAAIGQSACLWTAPIGGFHPGYLPTPSSTTAGPLPPLPPASPTLLLPSSGEDSSRRAPVTIHRCSSSLNVPSASGLQHRQLEPGNEEEPHHVYPHQYLSVSASCLVDNSTVNSDEEGENMLEVKPGSSSRSQLSPSQPPCRLIRRDALIRRRRVRRLTEGSISPSVFLTSPPMVSHQTSEWISLSSETVVMVAGGLAQKPHSMGHDCGQNVGRPEEMELSLPCSLSSRSESSD